MDWVTTLGLAFAVASGWCWAAIRLGPRLGFVDSAGADALKTHERDAVPLGGVGLYLAVLTASLLSDVFDPALLVAATAILIVGVVDDRFGLSPPLRLALELSVAVFLGLGWGLQDKGVVYLLLAVALVVVAINAVNLFDGLDGLVGSTGSITMLGLAALATMNSAGALGPLVVAAGLAGFLLFNWHPARVFLGDGGSYLLALLIAAEVIRLSPGGELQLIATAGVLGVYLIDLIVTLIRRRAHRRPLFEGDRSHVYDQLRDRGWSVVRVVLAVTCAQIVLVAVAVVVREALGPIGGAVGAVGVVFAAVATLMALGFSKVE